MCASPSRRIEALYDRYGLDRLPGVDRRDVAGGYAHLAAMLAFVLVYLLNESVGVGWSRPPPAFLETPAYYAVAASIVLLSGFVGGFLAWRYLPERTPHVGVVAGLAASFFTHFLVGYVALFYVVTQVEYYSVTDTALGLVISVAGVYLLARDDPYVILAMYVLGTAGGYLFGRIRE